MRPSGWVCAAAVLLAGATAGRAHDAVDRLVRQLQGDALAAQDAAATLGRMGPQAEAAVPALAGALRRPDVAQPAAFALAHIGGSGALVLIEALNDQDSKTEWIAGRALLRAGRSAVPALAAQLRANDPSRRERAAGVLYEIGPDAAAALPALAAALDDRRLSFSDDARPDDGDGAAPAEVWAAHDAFESARRSAALALTRMGPRGEAVLAEAVQDRLFPPHWGQTLALLDDLRRNKVFLLSFQDVPADPRIALSLVPIILFQDSAALKPRLEGMRPHDRTERWTAAAALARLGHAPPASALPALRRMLHEPDTASRIAAADALKAYGPDAREAVPDLIALLDDPRYDPHFAGDIFYVGGFGAPYGHGVGAAAVESLLTMGPEAEARLIREGVPKLMRGLKSEDELARAHAAVALTRLGPKASAAAPALVEAYLHCGLNDRQPLQQALHSIGGDAAPPLVALFKDEELRKQWKIQDDLTGEWPTIRYVFDILISLGLRADGVAPDLVNLTKDPIPAVRAGAIRALVRIAPDGRATLLAVLAALKDPDVTVRGTAARSLARLGAPAKPAFTALREALKDDDNGVASDAAFALVRLGDDPKVPAARLATLLRGDPFDPALKVLRELGPRAKAAAPALLQRLESSDPLIQVQAADALSAVAPEEAKPAIPVLVRIMEDPHADKDCRTYSLQVLRAIGAPDRSEVPKLLDLLDDPVFRSANRWSEDELIALLEAMKADRASLLRAYHKVFGNDYTPDALLDTKEHVRRLMIELRANTINLGVGISPAKGLGDIGKPAEAAIPRLKEDLDDPAVRAWAAYALLRITGDNAVYLPMIIRGVRDDPDAAYALTELGPRVKAAVPALVEALDNPSDHIRWSAAHALGHMGPDARPAVPGLIKLLGRKSSGDPGGFFPIPQEAAAEALGEMGPAAKDAIPVLKVLTNDDDDRLAAAAEKALVKIEGSAGKP